MPKATPQAPGAFRIGQQVRLKDPVARSDLNGQGGSILGRDDARERWKVRMGDGATIRKFKTENLHNAEDENFKEFYTTWKLFPDATEKQLAEKQSEMRKKM